MKVFTTTQLQGLWPVGTAAIVVAVDKEQAVQILQNAVDHSSMPLQRVIEEILVEIDTTIPQAIILNDGDY